MEPDGSVKSNVDKVKPLVVQDYEVKVNFWDLSGHPEFFEVRNEFYKDTQGIILVYDVSQRITFQALKRKF